jgi:prepilin-type N-terminal cleavage/methylation domain-containing protein
MFIVRSQIILENDMKKQQLGFTLIELAIVLVIIGLLLGGVLKGQELINSAKVKSMATDFKNIQVYLYGYQDKFKALPGDDRAASTHLTGAANATTGGTPGDAVIQGLYGSSTATEESVLFWQHVRLAGLAAGPTDVAAENYFPVNADGGRIGIQSVATLVAVTPISSTEPAGLSGAYVICSEGVLGKYAKQLDSTMDDGVGDTGSMRIVVKATPSTGVAAPDDASPYVVCLAF